MNSQLLVQDVLSNLALWIPLAVTILSSLVTGLTAYPKAGGVVAFLQKVLGVLSWVEHVDAPQSVAAVKLPLTRTAKPVVLPVKAV